MYPADRKRKRAPAPQSKKPAKSRKPLRQKEAFRKTVQEAVLQHIHPGLAHHAIYSGATLDLPLLGSALWVNHLLVGDGAPLPALVATNLGIRTRHAPLGEFDAVYAQFFELVNEAVRQADTVTKVCDAELKLMEIALSVLDKQLPSLTFWEPPKQSPAAYTERNTQLGDFFRNRYAITATKDNIAAHFQRTVGLLENSHRGNAVRRDLHTAATFNEMRTLIVQLKGKLRCVFETSKTLFTFATIGGDIMNPLRAQYEKLETNSPEFSHVYKQLMTPHHPDYVTVPEHIGQHFCELPRVIENVAGCDVISGVCIRPRLWKELQGMGFGTSLENGFACFGDSILGRIRRIGDCQVDRAIALHEQITQETRGFKGHIKNTLIDMAVVAFWKTEELPQMDDLITYRDNSGPYTLEQLRKKYPTTKFRLALHNQTWKATLPMPKRPAAPQPTPPPKRHKSNQRDV